MMDRISFGQVALAAIYASPLMSLAMVAASNSWFVGVSPVRLIGPLIAVTLLLCVPTVVSNVVAKGLVGWLGGGLSGINFHLAIGLVAGSLLIWIVDSVGRGTAQIGGGPVGSQTFFALVLAALCNTAVIWAVWRFGWKSTID